MNIPVQPVHQDQKEKISIKKKFSHKRRDFDSSYSNNSSQEETSSSPEEGETVTIDAKEYKMFRMWRRRMERFNKLRHCSMKHHQRRHRMVPPPFVMPPHHPYRHCGKHEMPPPPFCSFGPFGMSPHHPHKHYGKHQMPPPHFGMPRFPVFW